MSKEKTNIEKSILWGVNVPSEIIFKPDESTNKLDMHIHHPEHHMYKDDAAFEAWALFLYEKKQYEIELSFDHVNWDGTFRNLLSEQTNYMRFLYRLWKFSEQLKWFTIDPKNQYDVDRFKTRYLSLMSDKKLINNIPSSQAKVSQSTNPGHIKTEHFFENAFVHDAKDILIKILRKTDSINIETFYNQLPVGLFEGNVQALTRIFPTGYLDLWGISDKNELCIFELKVATNEGNDVNFKPAGIISELFFYANYCKDLFIDQNYNKIGSAYRGYDKLVAACQQKITKIKAYFLAPEYHSQIKNSLEHNDKYIEKRLNETGNGQIEYRFITYNYNEIKPFADKVQQEATKG
jgi:hypothetical protein